MLCLLSPLKSKLVASNIQSVHQDWPISTRVKLIRNSNALMTAINSSSLWMFMTANWMFMNKTVILEYVFLMVEKFMNAMKPKITVLPTLT